MSAQSASPNAYVAAEGCDEALVLGICSSADEALMDSLMNMHEPAGTEQDVDAGRPIQLRVRSLSARSGL